MNCPIRNVPQPYSMTVSDLPTPKPITSLAMSEARSSDPSLEIWPQRRMGLRFVSPNRVENRIYVPLLEGTRLIDRLPLFEAEFRTGWLAHDFPLQVLPDSHAIKLELACVVRRTMTF